MTQAAIQNRAFHDEDAAREALEAVRWPDGPVCPHCGNLDQDNITKGKGKVHRAGLYYCAACNGQFTVTVGTVMERSKIPLSKWFAGIYLMCASKKGVSAHQLHRQLDITYKSAWFLCHRIREAMRDKSFPQLTGIVEADETYIHPKVLRGHRRWREYVQDEIEMGLRPKPRRKGPFEDKPTVFGILERGGKVRTMVVPEVTAQQLAPILRGFIDQKNARLITDGHPAYRLIKKEMPHEVIDHSETYVVGDVHTQGIENYWSLLKRGLVGVFHHVDAEYLPGYLSEFEFRFNRRKIDDEDRFASLMGQTQGRVLWFCQTPQPLNPHA